MSLGTRGWMPAVTALLVTAGFLNACSFLFPEHLEPPWGQPSDAPKTPINEIADTSFADIPADSEVVLFEIAYFNSAWGLQQRGTYIDAGGRIFKYELKHHIWKPESNDRYTHKELMEKFAHKELFGKVEADELIEMQSLIPGAAQEELIEHGCCNDAGTLEYLAYVYLEHGKYQPVPLYQSGDSSGENPSEAAMILSQWLYSITGGKGNLYLDDKFCHCSKD